MLLLTAVNNIKKYSHRGDQTITSDTITSDIVGCVMDARREILSQLPKRYLWKKSAAPLVTVASTDPNRHSLASDVQEPIIFYYTSGTTQYKLIKIMSDAEWYGQVYNVSSSTGKPLYYREIGLDTNGYKQIEMFPIADAAYSVYYEYYKTVATDMTVSDLNTQIPDIPEHNTDALWKGGYYYFLKAFDDPAQVVAKADYDAARLKLNISEDADEDTCLRMRWGTDYQEPRASNGLRIF